MILIKMFICLSEIPTYIVISNMTAEDYKKGNISDKGIASIFFKPESKAESKSEFFGENDIEIKAIQDIHPDELVILNKFDIIQDNDIYEYTIFEYNRIQAINDGTYVDVNHLASQVGIEQHTAITRNLYEQYINLSHETVETQNEINEKEPPEARLVRLLVRLRQCRNKEIGTIDDGMYIFNISFLHEDVKIWAFDEANGSTDPTVGINIMLPEDY